jgi:hypothetical protein
MSSLIQVKLMRDMPHFRALNATFTYDWNESSRI